MQPITMLILLSRSRTFFDTKFSSTLFCRRFQSWQCDRGCKCVILSSHKLHYIYPCRASTITCFPRYTMKEETWFGECLCLTNVVIALHIVNHIIYLRFVSFESTSINAERVLNFGSIGNDMTKNELRASNFLIEIEEVYAPLR